MPSSSRIQSNRIFVMVLTLVLLLPTINSGSAAQTLKEQKKLSVAEARSKLAPDLEESLISSEQEAEKAPKTLGEVRREKQPNSSPLASVWSKAAQASSADEMQRVIVNLSGAANEATMKSCLTRLGGKINKLHQNMALATIEVPRSRIRELAAETDVEYVSPDRPTMAFGHIETTTGAEQARKLSSSLTTIDGTGVGIAVIDSGVDSNHKLIRSSKTHPGLTAYTDFVGTNAIVDRYGHGTYVASLAIGSNALSNGVYEGIAPNANLINLKVLNDNGTGFTSSMIAAIDWCIINKTTYNIRVINLSVGTPAKDSYKNDPLCLAVRRAHTAGIVVVVAAGNEGKDRYGNKIYGGIHSPGIDPSVITVGATNTFSTDKRSDDKIATYSSRGPTRGYYGDGVGVKHYDNLIKPDLVAPGNKLIGASSDNPGGDDNFNNLILSAPALAVDPTQKVEDRMMYLSGTSAATPIVAGAAALLLEVNPNLTPNLVKAILMYTAQPMAGYNILEQGTGMLNIDGAIRVARLVRSDTSSLSNGSSMLTSLLPAAQSSVIVNETCQWGQGVITNYCFLHGSDLMNYWQGVYARNYVLADATKVTNGAIIQIPALTSSGVLNNSGVVFANGNGALADGKLIASGVVFADGITYSSGVVFADGKLAYDPIFNDQTVKSKVVIVGD